MEKVIRTIFFLSLNLILNVSAFSFDHEYAVWTKVLEKNTKKIDGQVLVDYKQLKKTPEKLNQFLNNLESLPKKKFYKFSKKEQLAFWINAYNAYTIKIVIENYPIKSIKDIGSIFSSTWSKRFISLFGEKMSLDGIEHKTIREQFEEPRIHFALNCASIGCPSLYQKAFIPSKLESQLVEVTNSFMKNKRKNYRRANVYYISKIFDWYGEDFDKYTMGVQNFINKYLDQVKTKNVKIKYLDYDWNLNSY